MLNNRIQHFIGILPILGLLLLSGCATGGDPGSAGDRADVRPTQRTNEPAARPTKPPVVSQPRAIQRPSTAFAKGRQDCKVKKDSVEWVFISGGCRNGYAHGEGRARSVDRRRSYAGSFVDGAFSGKGEYDWGNGVHYSGEFLNGGKNGFGTLIYPDNCNSSWQPHGLHIT